MMYRPFATRETIIPNIMVPPCVKENNGQKKRKRAYNGTKKKALKRNFENKWTKKTNRNKNTTVTSNSTSLSSNDRYNQNIVSLTEMRNEIRRVARVNGSTHPDDQIIEESGATSVKLFNGFTYVTDYLGRVCAVSGNVLEKQSFSAGNRRIRKERREMMRRISHYHSSVCGHLIGHFICAARVENPSFADDPLNLFPSCKEFEREYGQKVEGVIQRHSYHPVMIMSLILSYPTDDPTSSVFACPSSVSVHINPMVNSHLIVNIVQFDGSWLAQYTIEPNFQNINRNFQLLQIISKSSRS